MPRITRSRAIARLIAEWLDHRLHQPRSVETLPLSKLLTEENIAATAALDLWAVFDDEIRGAPPAPHASPRLDGR